MLPAVSSLKGREVPHSQMKDGSVKYCLWCPDSWSKFWSICRFYCL